MRDRFESFALRLIVHALVLLRRLRHPRTKPWFTFEMLQRMTPEQRDRFFRETGIAAALDRSMAEADAMERRLPPVEPPEEEGVQRVG